MPMRRSEAMRAPTRNRRLFWGALHLRKANVYHVSVDVCFGKTIKKNSPCLGSHGNQINLRCFAMTIPSLKFLRSSLFSDWFLYKKKGYLQICGISMLIIKWHVIIIRVSWLLVSRQKSVHCVEMWKNHWNIFKRCECFERCYRGRN